MHNKFILDRGDFLRKNIQRKIEIKKQEYISLFCYFFFLPNLYYNCADIKDNLTTIQILPWKLSHAILCKPLGNSSLCPIKHYSFFFPTALQLLKHYGTLDKENKYFAFNGFLICCVYTNWHTINYHKYIIC